jgi:hypothetical protein
MGAAESVLGVPSWSLGTPVEGEPIPVILSAAINDYVTVRLSMGLVSHTLETQALAATPAQSRLQLLMQVLPALQAEGPVTCTAEAESNNPAHLQDAIELDHAARDWLARLIREIGGPTVEHIL